MATFNGEPTKAMSSDESAITVSDLSTNLTLTTVATGFPGTPSGITAVLKTGATPISGRSITFVASGTGSAAGQGFVRTATTDASGVAALGATPSVPVGAYTLKAYFSGTIDIHPWGPPPASLALSNQVLPSRACPRRAR